MNTPNLDALLADCSDKADSDRMFLFHDHGSALVVVLQDLYEFFVQNHEDVGLEVYGRVNGKELTPSAQRLNELLAHAKNLLTQLDQEATCQK